MHINQAKDGIIKSLKGLGFKPYSVKGGNGDFRISPSGKHKRIQVMVLNGSDLRNTLKTEGDKICSSIEGGCKVRHEDGKAYFSNSAWEVDIRKRRRISNDTTTLSSAVTSSHSQNPNGNGLDSENEKEKPESDYPREYFNTELKRLGMSNNRLETILDEFILHRMGIKELFGQLYEGLKKEGVEVYTTKAQIQISGNSFVIPHITKENFVEIGLRSIKKS